ncbi:MAG: hypothetical protein COU83_03055 [Candidatus Portnoybacteria bacterium CG10_big_fil_rev_8_21_14_0_10_40_22]|uniref:HEPN domain-containing protein n=2 Tax=Candidatus Portnoyibacteriota TaxID=1817913 RepID=A0A2M8KFB7_9BACT|nr:MAG: hypothetical protein COY09_00830 [Candidatus Portnoybacteria bacterium CG_4_10_14_0_2_um_filter_39_11]PJE58597.1 MAG: hypothetical protein COU83_03055 [Candidatus Portnoybacteria bacterium CG10_big_fil_rev_8_21_14_0_10_40_22]
MKQNNHKIAAEWFYIGEEESKFAKASFEELDAFYPQICFQCQQAVEKYLKGFLAEHQKPFPKIHDLVSLLKLCAVIEKDFLKFLDQASVVSQYYLITRYPLEYPTATRANAEEALRASQEIIDFIKSKVFVKTN